MTFDLKRLSPAHWLQCASALLLTASVALGNALTADVLKHAIGNGHDRAADLSDFVNACDNVLKPIFSISIATTPLVVVGGAGMLALGNSRGSRVIVMSLFAMILVATAKEFAT
ncbi:MAG TPA: hypothetical protein VN635_01235 [Conexibacter sp.]|nr:hypothetical protein [Conexibacter sp.]